jgi:hypothetical protein
VPETRTFYRNEPPGRFGPVGCFVKPTVSQIRLALFGRLDVPEAG